MSSRVFALVSLGFAACSRPPQVPAAPLDGGLHAQISPRLDSVVVTGSPDGTTLVAFSSSGQRLWATALPDGDRRVGPAAVAPDSSLFVRGHRALYSIAPGGKVNWSFKLAEFDATDEVKAPAGLRNSGVIFALGSDVVLALSPDGAEMWRHKVPGKAPLTSAPVVAPNGTITYATSGTVVQLADDGLLVWQRGTDEK